MAELNKLTVNSTKNRSTLGKETLYICQNPACGLEEKEFALVSRNYKLCQNCGTTSVKSHLVETYNWVTSTLPVPTFGE